MADPRFFQRSGPISLSAIAEIAEGDLLDRSDPETEFDDVARAERSRHQINEMALLGADRDEKVLHCFGRNDLREALALQLAGEEARRKGDKFEAIFPGRRMESLERAARGVGAKGIDEAIGHGILHEERTNGQCQQSCRACASPFGMNAGPLRPVKRSARREREPKP